MVVPPAGRRTRPIQPSTRVQATPVSDGAVDLGSAHGHGTAVIVPAERNPNGVEYSPTREPRLHGAGHNLGGRQKLRVSAAARRDRPAR